MPVSSCKESRRGSAIVEAAIIFPIIILITATAITLGVKLYVKLKTDSDEHRVKVRTQYEIFEKGRFLVSFHSDDIRVSDDIHLSLVHTQS